MPQYLRQRFYIELRYFYRSYGKGMANLVELDFGKRIAFEKARKELPIRSRLGRLCFACQKELIGVVRIKLFDNVT